jgi:hypothetical protein
MTANKTSQRGDRFAVIQSAGSGDPRRARARIGGVRRPAPSAYRRGRETRAERVQGRKPEPNEWLS